MIVSDTHGRHDEYGALEGDVLIHCGDGSESSAESVAALDEWFGRQRCEHVLAVGGNHDFEILRRTRNEEQVFRHARFLLDEAVELGGLRFYGSPWVPGLFGWAFYAKDETLAGHWARIPSDTDVLITHTPPAGILDRDRGGYGYGCAQLLRRVDEIEPRVHCFGHIHASGGVLERSATTFVNASSVTHAQPQLRPPVVLEL
ncbi:MAG: metallophosphatase domain-containing protein [Myxococcales bacterium]|nr:metallophosphatase domain-containing protein [Myxococcales bacterium]